MHPVRNDLTTFLLFHTSPEMQSPYFYSLINYQMLQYAYRFVTEWKHLLRGIITYHRSDRILDDIDRIEGDKLLQDIRVNIKVLKDISNGTILSNKPSQKLVDDFYVFWVTRYIIVRYTSITAEAQTFLQKKGVLHKNATY